MLGRRRQGWLLGIFLLGAGGLVASEPVDPIVFEADASLTILVRDSVRTFGEGGTYSEDPRERFLALQRAFHEACQEHEEFPLAVRFILFPSKPDEGQPYLQVRLLDWRMRVTGEYEVRLAASLHTPEERRPMGIVVGRCNFAGNPSIRSLWDKHRVYSASKAWREILEKVRPHLSILPESSEPAEAQAANGQASSGW